LLHKLAGHPHIAGLNCWFEETNGDIYLDLPFYPAGTLREWLGVERPEAHKRVALRQLLMALLHLLAHGVVHCDVKPENIFLQSADPPFLKLGDFDVSKDSDGRATATVTHRAATVAGYTELYAAPELLQGRPASPSSDVYAAGLVCLEMFLPNEARARTPGQTPTLPAGAPDSLPGLLRRWLAADPANRPTPAQILAHQFFEQDLKKLDAVEKKLEGMEGAQQAARGPARTCCVCCCDELESGEALCLADGVDCPSGQPAHFVCDLCLALLASSSLNGPSFAGVILCPGPGCKGKYADQVLAQRLPAELFARLLKALLESKEKTLREELNAQNKRVLERELEEMQRRSVLQNQVLAAKRYVEEELMTLKCPRCRRAFADFSGCCALTCGGDGPGCGCAFCAWCLQDCGHDAHAHVRTCPRNPARGELFDSKRQFPASQRKRVVEAVRGYLGALGSGELRKAVTEALAVHRELKGAW